MTAAASRYRDRITDHPAFQALATARVLRAAPLGLIDVGARGDVDPLFQQLASLTALLGFEPDAGEAARLQRDGAAGWAGFRIEATALAERAGPVTLHLAAADTNHSLRPANAAFIDRYAMVKFLPAGEVRLQARTMDEVVFAPDGHPHWGELLKIDTQGTELEILRGAERTLAERTVAIVCEVEFAEVYRGQSLFSDVERFLRDRGFSFYGFSELHGRSRKSLDKRRAAGRERLLWSDAIFFKDPFAAGEGARPAPLADRALHALFATALMLGYYDFAVELAAALPGDGGGPARVRALVHELVHDLGAVDPAAGRAAVERLLAEMTARPELANILLGQFVDRRRSLCDYDDQPVDSPWRNGGPTLTLEA
ncbi:FkbM family methyltransferase [Azospirillum melinis]